MGKPKENGMFYTLFSLSTTIIYTANIAADEADQQITGVENEVIKGPGTVQDLNTEVRHQTEKTSLVRSMVHAALTILNIHTVEFLPTDTKVEDDMAKSIIKSKNNH